VNKADQKHKSKYIVLIKFSFLCCHYDEERRIYNSTILQRSTLEIET